MKINKNYFPIYISTAVGVGYLIGMLLSFSGNGDNPSKKKLNRLVDFISNEYVEEVNLDSIVELTVNNILEKLDPHSVYISSKDFEGVSENMKGDFVGIGVHFYMHNDTVSVVQTIEGGPSEHVGIKAGDRILMADQDTLYGKKLENEYLFSRLKGSKGSKLSLLVYRKTTGKKYRFTLERGLVNIKSIDNVSLLKKQTGYIKINRFSESTYSEFKSGLDRLVQKGIDTLVIDLRDNSGGYLNEAVKIADEFLGDNQLIVYTKDRKNSIVKTYATNEGSFLQGKLYILINESSASASEILAGAIQDNDRGLIVGRRSFGKGLVQKEMPLGDGSVVRLTVSRYYTPTGRSIQKSYKQGTEAYYNDFYKRFYDGELQHKDSAKVNDTLKFKTPKGKIVYGGGGIMPDIFVPISNAQQNENAYFTTQFGIVAHFVFEYLDKNRSRYQKMTPAQFASVMKRSQTTYDDFIRYSSQKGIDVDYSNMKESFMTEMTAEFIKQLYGEKAYFNYILSDDPMIKKVIGLRNKN